MKPVSFLIGGDLVPTKSNFDFFSSGDINKLVDNAILDELYSVDFRVFNLEVPLTDAGKPICKCGPNLIAPTSSINGIKALNPSVICLANNHILDQDENGLLSTIKQLQKFNIDYVGSGKNLTEAFKPYVLEKIGKKIGIYACAEHEFTIATETMAGANPFEPLESLDHIVALKSKCDYVIVLYHGGKEHYRYPSPYLQKVCRKMVQKGADLIICQHSHCIGCYEEFEGSTIVYGQGNFLFDRSESELWKTSLLIKASISDRVYVDYIPIVKSGNGVRLADYQVAENILAAFHQRSAEILQDGFVEQQYRQFARDSHLLYVRHFAGFGKWLSRLDRCLFNGMLTRRKYNSNQLLAIRNFIECEAHRELVLAGLQGENECGKNQSSK